MFILTLAYGGETALLNILKYSEVINYSTLDLEGNSGLTRKFRLRNQQNSKDIDMNCWNIELLDTICISLPISVTSRYKATKITIRRSRLL
jgi:hypothetical protein